MQLKTVPVVGGHVKRVTADFHSDSAREMADDAHTANFLSAPTRRAPYMQTQGVFVTLCHRVKNVWDIAQVYGTR
jgi:hypothetical protein